MDAARESTAPVTKRWSPGDELVLRLISLRDGEALQGLPARVIDDGEHVLAVHVANGTRFLSHPALPAEQRAAAVRGPNEPRTSALAETMWRGDCIRLYLPGRAYSVWLLFGPDWKFNWWYMNLEPPLVRSSIGLDLGDHCLDVAGRPDGRWWWKDEDEFARRLELGVDTAEHQAAVRAAGREVIALFEARGSPFSDGWEYWRPPPDWSPAVLPEDWRAI